jgi:glycosyltransferase involved in cell wall biosynthesis
MNEKPRLLIVTEVYPKQYQSYMGIYVREQLLELQKYFRITVITTFEESFFQRKLPHHPKYLRENEIEVFYIRYYPSWLWIFQKLGILKPTDVVFKNKINTAKKISCLAKKLHNHSPFTLVHGHEVYLGDEAGPIGIKLGIPSIFTLHGWYPEHVKNFGQKTVDLAIQNIVTITKLIADSKSAAESYQSKVQKKFTLIPNGVNLIENTDLPIDIQKFCKNEFTLLSVGSLSPSKRFSMSLDCLASVRNHGFPNCRLIIVGKGIEKSSLVSKTKTLGISRYVLFLQDISRSALSAVIYRSTIVIHPSCVDAFSLICLEGMAAGKPVIADERIGIMEFVRPGIDILKIPADRPEQFQEKVLELLNDAKLRTTIGKSALQASKKFQWPLIAEKIYRVYEAAQQHE